MDIDCIIWDCDGCLIDSEVIACGQAAKVFTEIGYPITAQEYIERFAGQGIPHTIKLLEEETGKQFAKDFPFLRSREERDALFHSHLKPVKGVHEALSKIEVPMCIASGSEPDRLKLTLEITSLYECFEGRIYSATEVENGKPAPDLFLYAAQKMAVLPQNCLVIEDSVNGVRAAHAAGMTVFGFCGASHVSEKWIDALKRVGVDALFDDMRELPDLVYSALAQN